MRLELFSLAIVALAAQAAWAAQPITPQPMVVPVNGPHVAYAPNSIVPGAGYAACGHGHGYSACGPQAHNAFSACGCSGCGHHAGGYGCCPKPACDGSIWTATYYPRSRNLHLWDTYCADTTPCPHTGHDMNGLFHNTFGPCHKWANRGCQGGQCQLHSYHRQNHMAMPVGYASGGMHLDPAMMPYTQPEASAAPNEQEQPESAPAPPATEENDTPPAEEQPPVPMEGSPLLSPDAVQLAPAINDPASSAPAHLDGPPAPTTNDAVDAPAPRL